jgi:hypothetical protein
MSDSRAVEVIYAEDSNTPLFANMMLLIEMYKINNKWMRLRIARAIDGSLHRTQKRGARIRTASSLMSLPDVSSPIVIPTSLFTLAAAPRPPHLSSCSSDQGRGTSPRRGQLHLPAAQRASSASTAAPSISPTRLPCKHWHASARLPMSTGSLAIS